MVPQLHPAGKAPGFFPRVDELDRRVNKVGPTPKIQGIIRLLVVWKGRSRSAGKRTLIGDIDIRRRFWDEDCVRRAAWGSSHGET